MQESHMFHVTSSYINQVLLCAFEVYAKHLAGHEAKKNYTRMKGAILEKVEKEARKENKFILHFVVNTRILV